MTRYERYRPSRRVRLAMSIFLLIDKWTWRFGPRVGRNRLVLAVKRPLIRIFAP
jgi:hypothetical protein